MKFKDLIEWAIAVEYLVNHCDEAEDTMLEEIIESKHMIENLKNENRMLEQEIIRLREVEE